MAPMAFAISGAKTVSFEHESDAFIELAFGDGVRLDAVIAGYLSAAAQIHQSHPMLAAAAGEAASQPPVRWLGAPAATYSSGLDAPTFPRSHRRIGSSLPVHRPPRLLDTDPRTTVRDETRPPTERARLERRGGIASWNG